ncbi:cobalamin adenosyltransferase, methylmalonyl-CoA mutase cofactor biosynthesis protein [Candidatus Endolissoclinum faulkneri L5]|uniref:Corrinoid adenosyltransferase n=1 Tax=Candidatus Endolissoclinum faulkneri L5 TaxID=1401328 RepID=V9TR41_9PROT|nr:cob(I)yrinic acid a,c-diamide adenosyltransferase [Candidatus Endolissoclinum faulkneri]AHC73359.1 cobalamin adenosyltransferase, methylmalonyl-CoA mutase cofactor biosynthesis protein [Candidatus Endolissoclinum faulkneri L5]
MVKLTNSYTRAGDSGQTSLGDGTRIVKHALRPNAYGTVDETNAAIGIARLNAINDGGEQVDYMLARIQNDLFDLGADLSNPEQKNLNHPSLRITPNQVLRLEREIDKMNNDLQPINSFIIPGGKITAAYLQLARTIARRAEREITLIASVETINGEVIKYMNRLSDHLFVLARWVNDKGATDVLWTPGANK